MTDPLVAVERRPSGVAVITLQRADRLNALSVELADALAAAVDEVDDDSAIRALVVAGAGRAFSAGADIAALGALDSGEDFGRFVDHLTNAFDRLAASAKPSVAAVHGVALGGGLELALACDLRVADEGARLGVPEVALGLLPGAGGTARLPRLVPLGVATEMLLTGEPLHADAALAVGLINRIAPGGTVLEVATALADRLASLPPLALATAKRLLGPSRSLALDDALHDERRAVSGLFDTEDRAEGVGSFLAKRAPRFNGR